MRTIATLALAMLLLQATKLSAQTWELLPYTYQTGFLAVPRIFASPDDKLLVAGVYFEQNREISVSTDGGTTWQQVFPGKTLISVEFGPDGTSYMITGVQKPNVNAYQPDTIFSSTDGITWVDAGFRLNEGTHKDNFTISGNNTLLFTMRPGGTGVPLLAKSTDNGATWTNTSGSDSRTVCSYTADTILQNTDSPFPGGVKYSHDGGATFTDATGLSAEALPLLLPDGVAYAATVGQVFKSTDGGQTFTQVTLPGQLGQTRSMYYRNGKIYVHVGGGVRGIWETTDFTTLNSLTAGFVGWNRIMDVDLSNNYIYVTTADSTLYRYKIASGNAIDQKPIFASGITIYPNPASGIVQVALANNTPIDRLVLTDPTGRTVKAASGTHQLNTEGIAPGIYYLKVYAQGASHTEKLVIQ